MAVSALFGLVVAFDQSRLWWVVWFDFVRLLGLVGVVCVVLASCLRFWERYSVLVVLVLD